MRLSIVAFAFAFLCPMAHGAVLNDKPFYEMSQKEIARTILETHKAYPRLSDRIVEISALFLGTPYRLGPLGEGAHGVFDKNPLISFKAVDCTTFVEETMALSLAQNFEQVPGILNRIRYKNGKVSYQTRNHFPSADWIPNNIAAGFLKDITAQVAGKNIKTAVKVISKRIWYAEKKAMDLQNLTPMSAAKQVKLLENLRRLGEKMPDQKVAVPYVPIEDLPAVLNRIPSGTIANLVRADKPSMPVLISHQVFIVDKGGVAYVRHAAWNQFVQDVPALDYFQRYLHSDWKLLGLNLLQITAPSKNRSK